jgi:hypothetical protein
MTIPHDQIERARAVRIENERARRGIKLRRVGHELIGPCPKCGGRDRFSISVVKNCWHCRQCKAADVTGDVIGFVMWLDNVEFAAAIELLAGDQARPAAKRAHGHGLNEGGGHQPDDAASIASALRWWRDSGPIDGTLAELYLRLHREITKPPDLSHVLRYHPRVVFGQGDDGQWLYRPCMLALYRDVITDSPTGVHRFGLNPDASLIGRMAMGRKRGSAVKLWPDEAVTTALVVGEGIETVLAAAMHVTHRGTSLQPAWSAIDAPGLKAFPPPLAGIEHLTVLADHDSPKRREDGTIWYPGQEAAHALAKRWAKGGVAAEVLTPTAMNSDFNDLVMQVGAVTS